jgi:hypothetical protein
MPFEEPVLGRAAFLAGRLSAGFESAARSVFFTGFSSAGCDLVVEGLFAAASDLFDLLGGAELVAGAPGSSVATLRVDMKVAASRTAPRRARRTGRETAIARSIGTVWTHV